MVYRERSSSDNRIPRVWKHDGDSAWKVLTAVVELEDQ